MKKNTLFLSRMALSKVAFVKATAVALALAFGLVLMGCPTETEEVKEFTLTQPAVADGSFKAYVDNKVVASGAKVKAGVVVKLVATPASGKVFRIWAGASVASTTAATTTFTMPEADVTITATFGALDAGEYAVTTSVPAGNGTVTADPGYGKAKASINLIVAPAAGYTLKSLTPSVGTIAPAIATNVTTYTLTLPDTLTAAVTVTAVFEGAPSKITLPKDTEKGGVGAQYLVGNDWKEIPDAGVPAGATVQLKVEANEGYVLDTGTFAVKGASGTVVIGSFWSENYYRFTMPAEVVTVTANFAGPMTINGTLSVKVNGTAIDFAAENAEYHLTAYPDAKYMNQLGEGRLTTTGTWTMSIPETYKDKTVYFQLYDNNKGASYNLGGNTVGTTAIALSKEFTTKTISGTVKDGTTPVMAQIILLDGTADTVDAFVAKFYSGEIAILGQAQTESESETVTGEWTASVLSDVTSAYILVIAFTSDYSSAECYITKDKVTLTTTPIALDIATMNDIGAYPMGSGGDSGEGSDEPQGN
jgi:hypothetical protein